MCVCVCVSLCLSMSVHVCPCLSVCLCLCMSFCLSDFSSVALVCGCVAFPMGIPWRGFGLKMLKCHTRGCSVAWMEGQHMPAQAWYRWVLTQDDRYDQMNICQAIMFESFFCDSNPKLFQKSKPENQ